MRMTLSLLLLAISCGGKKEKTIYVTGEKGEQGELGATGETGPKGDKGEPGSQGMNGENGVGMAGDRGEPGPQGEPGRDGVDGQRGDRGSDGESIIVPQPKYSKYCYGYHDYYYRKAGCVEYTLARYHIYYQPHVMPNGDVFGRMCEGYRAKAENCSDGLLTTKTWTIGDPEYSSAPLVSRYVSAKLIASDKAEIKGKDFTLQVTCNNLP